MKPLDTVSVLVPSKPEYVSVVRLTASGIASRMGFDIDDIEDIKVSISEVINRMIDKRISFDGIKIDFHLYSDLIRIDFRLSGSSPRDIFESEEGNFALEIIRSLMDEVNLNWDDGASLSMIKSLKGLSENMSKNQKLLKTGSAQRKNCLRPTAGIAICHPE